MPARDWKEPAMANSYDLSELKSRMQKSISSLKDELVGLRTGRASASLLEPVTVDAYGSRMPLNQVATVTVPEPRMLSVQVWDRSMASAVERAIRDSGLGLNPMAEGQVIRVPLPELNEERRRELTKVANTYAEQARVAVRHIRRDGMDALKKAEKDGDMAQDDAKKQSDLVQKATDDAVAEIDSIVAVKEQEIMQV
jgi:ribosome recycling factor